MADLFDPRSAKLPPPPPLKLPALKPEEPPPTGWRRFYRGYMHVARVMGEFMAQVIMTVIYVLMLPFFQFIRLSDPLRRRLTDQPSYYEERAPVEADLERHLRQF